MKPFLYVIKKHREIGTHMDGPRCPMYPSCSSYAQEALNRYSVLGLLIFIDRLFFRETGSLRKKYMMVPKEMSRTIRYFDPLRDALPLAGSGVREPSLLTEDFPD